MNHLPRLDGVRGIAISTVLLTHGLHWYFPGGWAGVDLFFVLSGFLITNILVSEYDKTGSIRLKNFYGRRFLRLFPALFLGLCLVGALMSLGLVRQQSLGEFARACAAVLFYYTNFVDPAGLETLGTTWSLAVEEQFYLAWPLVLGFFVLRFKPGVRLLLVATFIATITGLRLILHLNHFESGPLYHWPFTRGDALMWGALVAFASRLPAGAPLVRTCRVLFFPAMGYLLFVLLKVEWYDHWMFKWGLAANSAACALLIYCAIHVKKSFLLDFLAFKPLVWVGKRSYGIYLYHYPLCWAFYHLFHKDNNLFNAVWVFAAQLVVIMFLAWLSFKLVESRALAMKDVWFPVGGESKKPRTNTELGPCLETPTSA